MKTLQTQIIKRFYNEKEIQSLLDSYREARYSQGGGRMQPPTPKQERLARLAKEVGYTNAARKVGVPVTTVHAAVNRVGRYTYLTSK